MTVGVLDTDTHRARAVATHLTELGFDAEAIRDRHPAVHDTLVHLCEADPVDAFATLRDALEGGAKRILGVDLHHLGLDGLYKTAAREYPETPVRLLTTPTTPPEALATRLSAELACDTGPTHVTWSQGERHAHEVTSAPLSDSTSPLPLHPESVVLLTGGARGITGAIARALAAEVPCTYVLVGRTALAEQPLEPELSHLHDAPELRRALIARGPSASPADVEQGVSSVLKDREIRATLNALESLGATVHYRACDVRNADAFSTLLDELYAEFDRLDGVIHGAGVLDDKLIRDKAPSSFARVYETKVNAAKVLMDKLVEDTSFVVFFGSISGVLGNRGQADYAAANATLDILAVRLGQRVNGRVVSIAWGPWGETGMVSPALARAYAKRGIPLLPTDEGVRAFLDELRAGPPDEHTVMWVAGHPDDFVGASIG